MTTILQILPAEGWVAKYQDDYGFIYTAVAALALVENETGRYVEAIDSEAMSFGGLCSEINNYAGVEFVGVDAVLELTAMSPSHSELREKPLDTPEGSTLRVVPIRRKDDDE